VRCQHMRVMPAGIAGTVCKLRNFHRCLWSQGFACAQFLIEALEKIFRALERDVVTVALSASRLHGTARPA
jgi:hypothetical protein